MHYRLPFAAGAIYVVPHLSYQRFKLSDFSIRGLGESVSAEGPSEWDLGASTGLGALFGVGADASLFVEGNYAFVFTEGQNMQYALLRMGVILGLGR
ncbi:MAG TPA: hypothetical protein VFG50_00650 [Rhodothermales bacterium]|nr:hypothetical protein [Rhodothermales bacterium]